MQDARGYRWGAIFFALVLAASLASLPYALSCCSRFPTEDLAISATFGKNGWAAGMTPLSVALLDWPMGFRLLILTIVASGLCFIATVAGFFISRRMQTDSLDGGNARMWLLVSDAVLGSLMVGVLYVLAAYAVGYIGYVGPLNALWILGAPLAVAVIQQSRPSWVIGWALPLLLGGWFCTALISMIVGIPLD